MPSFARIGTTRVYAESGTPPADAGFAAYVAMASSGTPSSFTPAVAWSDPMLTGYFLFLPQPIAAGDLAAFASAVEQSTAFPVPAQTSLAWVRWEAGALSPPQIVRVVPTATGRATSGDVAFLLGPYGVRLFDATPVEFAAAPDRLTFTVPPDAGGPAPNGRGLTLPFDGEGRFCFEGEGLLGDLSDDVVTGFDVAPRFFAERNSAVVTYRYPLFDAFAAGFHVLVDTRWDPVSPSRSQLAFTPLAFMLAPTGDDPAWAITGVPLTLPTALRTTYGDPIALAPVVGSAKLVLQPIGDPPRGWYLVPAGDYGLVLDASVPARNHQLLCGLGGTEFIRFDPATDRIRFVPNQPAFADGFAPAAARSRRARADAPLLTDAYVTAWVTFHGGGANPPTYFAQPDSAPLFTVDQNAPPNVLALFDAPAAVVSAGSDPFPLVPYARLEAGGPPPAEFARLEGDVLSPERKRRLGAKTITAADLGATAVTSTTPQGFLVDVEGTTWKSVQLATATRSDGVRQLLRINDVSTPLREALQSNQLFLVVTDPTNVASFEHVVSVVDWPFKIDLSRNQGATNDFRNVLIFKFGDGTLKERVEDLATWSRATDFNADPEEVRNWIRGYLASAELLAENTPRLKPFVARINDPSWNGVLALRVDIDVQLFPDDIAGLLGGIDLEQFEAHHFGIEVSFVSADQGLSMPASSLFGLIDYVDKDLPTGAASDARARITLAEPGAEAYDFRVLTLLIAFENSEIVTFESRIVVTITRLFDEIAERADPVRIPVLKNTFELRGHYEQHAGVSYYTFLGDAPVRFLTPTSTVLGYVEMLKAEFHTFKPARPSDDAVSSRFSFWGVMNFHDVGGIDVLSFGDAVFDPKGPATGLFFANLGIGMRFRRSDPRTTRTFTFETGLVSFDLGQSQPRAKSLFLGFPLTLAGMDEGNDQRTPTDAGYLPVAVKFTGTAKLAPRWFAIVFGVNLGTMGALAAEAGFTAELLVAWSPGGERPQIGVLLQLPGTGVGKKELSVEGVLKIGIGQLRLDTDPADPSKYYLFLGNIALVLFGMKLPSSSYAEIVLLGDPSGAKTGGNLGWYGAWFKPPATGPGTPPLRLSPPERS